MDGKEKKRLEKRRWLAEKFDRRGMTPRQRSKKVQRMQRVYLVVSIYAEAAAVFADAFRDGSAVKGCGY